MDVSRPLLLLVSSSRGISLSAGCSQSALVAKKAALSLPLKDSMAMFSGFPVFPLY
jgi:hypothetical protein